MSFWRRTFYMVKKCLRHFNLRPSDEGFSYKVKNCLRRVAAATYFPSAAAQSLLFIIQNSDTKKPARQCRLAYFLYTVLHIKNFPIKQKKHPSEDKCFSHVKGEFYIGLSLIHLKNTMNIPFCICTILFLFVQMQSAKSH